MIQAFYTGIGGIQAHQSAIDVTSDNIANVNTVGFRSYTTEFSSLLEEATATDALGTSVDSSVGIGTTVQATGMDLSQGSFQTSDRATDLAISGDGWFGVSTNDQVYYTRAGNFTFDSNNDLVTPEGMFVLGTLGDNIDLQNNLLKEELSDVALGDVTKQQKLQLPQTLTYPPQATTKIDFFGNIGTLNEPQAISAKAIDGEGNINKVTLSFVQSKEQPEVGIRWDVKATVSSLNDEVLYSTQEGVVNFDETGGLISNTLTTVDNNGSPIALNLGENFSGVIAVANVPTTGSSRADGVKGGELAGYDINQNAEIIATFSNGKQSSIAQIGVFHFVNDQGLERISGTLFSESSNSGKALFFQDKDGENILGAKVANHTLETSNVALENGLTELIIYQRSYDANAKSVTTADQMIQKALQMDA